MTSKTPDPNTPPEPKEKKSLIVTALDFVDSHFLNIPKKPKEERLAKLSAEQRERLQVIEESAIADFHGTMDELESALGMLRIGHHVGWKVLYLIHSKRTIRKYEQLLDIKVREEFPETGPSSYRSYGLNIAQNYPNFWKVVGGDIKIPDRKKLE